jgi:hypothetical protein
MTSKPVAVTIKGNKVKVKRSYRDASKAVRERKSKKQRPIRRTV